ncbi:MAG TPA: hypothetical protein VLI06_16925 [Solimonas sp.]|nr:hypothetical protein [Solimonas sp.]
MPRAAWIGLGVLAVAGAGWGLWHWQQDDFDYEAAFEMPESQQAVDAPGVLLRVPELAGRSPEEVEQKLGRAVDCEDSLYSRRCRYPDARTSVLFIDGKADWFLADFGDSGYPLQAETLAALGLPEGKPADSDKRELVWRDFAGFREVRLVGNTEGIVTHALIKVSAR